MERNSNTRSKNVHGLSDLSPAQVEARMAAIGKHLDAIEALLEDAKGLSAAQRRSAMRLRGTREVDALHGVLEFASVHAELFGALADEDEGVDPSTFETDVLVNRLQNAQTLSSMADRIGELESKLADCALYTTQLVKPVALKAYEIAKPFASRVQHGDLVFPAQNFYRETAVTAAKSRAKKKATQTS